MGPRVDLNADLGEVPGSIGESLDADLLDIVSSANIACGGHAGDPDSMRRVTAAAAAHSVAIGAHVSYPDREHFGRRPLAFTPEALLADLRQQTEDLMAAAAEAGSAVRYIKAHGALYNAATVNDAPAALLLELAREYGLPLLTQHDGRLAQLAAQEGIPVFGEFFADRAYEATGRLRERGEPGAVLTDSGVMAARVIVAVRDHAVTSYDGASVPVVVDSVCLHSDTPRAVDLAASLRRSLEEHGVSVAPFVELVP